MKICVPITGHSFEDIAEELNYIRNLTETPDVIELRADYIFNIDVDEVLKSLEMIKWSFPVMLTTRIRAEGGMSRNDIPLDLRKSIILTAIEEHLVDYVDIEAANDLEFIYYIADRKADVKIIVSGHNFQCTPPEDELIRHLKRSAKLGADFVKYAAMPKSPEDVLTLLSATYKYSQMPEAQKAPPITMSMNEIGLQTRIFGEKYGSQMTFASGKNPTAPGQIPLVQLRNALKYLT
ncbi:3-dehydroquinate dehydratase [Clostridia bacterium]|nr:3-dehydroquinate dehydratase [Clostridia bacterium]